MTAKRKKTATEKAIDTTLNKAIKNATGDQKLLLLCAKDWLEKSRTTENQDDEIKSIKEMRGFLKLVGDSKKQELLDRLTQLEIESKHKDRELEDIELGDI